MEPDGGIPGALSRYASGDEEPSAAPGEPPQTSGDGEPAAAPAEPREPSAFGIASALASYSMQSATKEPSDLAAAGPSPRQYRVGEVAVVLGVFAAAMLTFDSEGLMTWARRMEVGAVQSGLLSALGRLHRAHEAIGLTAPRRAAIFVSDRLARSLGAGEDPLFAEGWRGEPGDPVDWVRAPVTAGEFVEEPEVEPEAAQAGPGETADVAVVAAPDTPAGGAGPTAMAAASPVGGPPAVAEGGGMAPVVGAESQQTVLLVGDSLLAGNLAGAISRALARNPRVRVVQALQSATGLSRPDVFDWMKVVPALLEREKPLLIVCSFGANDAQGIRQGARLLEFGDSGWRAAYRERVLEMMRALSGEKTRVLWLGLPPMRDPRLTERARLLNRIFKSAPKKVPRVEYLELGMLVSGTDGEFATFAPDAEGRFTRLRMEDGVHYSPAGARAIARWVVDWIGERLPRPAARGRR
ncbi:MAG: SGNH/GDSL hydrolase family protein [Myxococcaceae bacterium]